MNVVKIIGLYILFVVVAGSVTAQDKIDRYALVSRHNAKVSGADSLTSLSVGNGKFAFTVDVTGLQTFPEFYTKGVALGTQSEWGWHSFPNTGNYKIEEAYREYDLEGRKIKYTVQVKEPKRSVEASDYFRVNLHRMQLGNVGLDITKKDGTPIVITDIKNIQQELHPWTGAIISRFTVENEPVEVITYSHQQQDVIAAKINSQLIQQGRLKVRIRFPYPTGGFLDAGTNYTNDVLHTSNITYTMDNGGIINHTLDTTSYLVQANWQGKAKLQKKSPHYFSISPDGQQSNFSFTVYFTPKQEAINTSFDLVKANSEASWKQFWMSGGAIDFTGSTDARAYELERRVILSQYLTKVQCAGSFPPQETGLTYNSWFGKPHMEMYWWHAAHFALWNRTELLEKSLDWYFGAAAGAKAIAQRQGFDGVRWQKMTDNEGREAPSSVGAFLIWQQPHLIYLTELVYRNKKDKKVLDKYKDLVFATADFMASFPTYDKKKDQYNLGKGLIPAQECFSAVETYNPTYELAYWSWALKVAQDWRTRLGMPRKKEWDVIINKLAPLPVLNGLYLATESTPNCYDPKTSKVLIDHPAVLAGLSTIPPSHRMDTAIMHRTFDTITKIWEWEHTWGWDFPLIAMTAARLNQPAKAIDGLFKNVQTNTYLVNGHNYQDDRLTIYLPGNGGILSAVAMMAAGWDASTTPTPGFPKDGTWKVKWEGLSKMF